MITQISDKEIAQAKRIAELEAEVKKLMGSEIGLDRYSAKVNAENKALRQQLSEAQRDVERYRNALNSAASSLDTIAMLRGIKEYGKPPIATYLETFFEVRGYAKNRAMFVFAAIKDAT
jgi:chromosome segregation ATPase